MPLLEVEVVLDVGETLPDGLAAALAQAAAQALAAPEGRTWVRLRSLPPEGYAEDVPLQGTPPVFVELALAHPPEGLQRAATLRRLTTAIAEATGRPAERVHVRLEPAAAGRQAFGGEVAG